MHWPSSRRSPRSSEPARPPGPTARWSWRTTIEASTPSSGPGACRSRPPGPPSPSLPGRSADGRPLSSRRPSSRRPGGSCRCRSSPSGRTVSRPPCSLVASSTARSGSATRSRVSARPHGTSWRPLRARSASSVGSPRDGWSRSSASDCADRPRSHASRSGVPCVTTGGSSCSRPGRPRRTCSDSRLRPSSSLHCTVRRQPVSSP